MTLLITLAPTTHAAQRVALVIGNGDYQTLPDLINPGNDASAMSKTLRELDFKVLDYTNLNARGMKKAIRKFGDELRRNPQTVGLFYYAGHGMQVKNVNYLLPVDLTAQREDEVEFEAVEVQMVLNKMISANDARSAGNQALNIVILDACRNNPLAAATRGGPRGLARMSAPSGSLIAFATEAGETADDGDYGNGLFTRHLLKHMKTPGLPLTEVMHLTRMDVAQATHNDQIPETWNKVLGRFYFKPGEQQVADLRLPVQPVSPPKTRRSFEPEMVKITGGEFEMGCVSGKDCSDDKRVHGVRVGDFWLGKYEVTVGEYLTCVEQGGCSNPEWLESGSQYNIQTGDNAHYKKMGAALTAKNHPIVGVSWNDATAYVAWLKGETGKGYRLPTEAEWEYAARAGSRTAYPWGNSIGRNKANCSGDNCGDSHQYTAPVGSFSAYGGLHDMIGNAWEWTCSKYDEDYGGDEERCAGKNDAIGRRALRGGSWSLVPWLLRSAYRYRKVPSFRYYGTGFRVARTR